MGGEGEEPMNNAGYVNHMIAIESQSMHVPLNEQVIDSCSPLPCSY